MEKKMRRQELKQVKRSQRKKILSTKWVHHVSYIEGASSGLPSFNIPVY